MSEGMDEIKSAQVCTEKAEKYFITGALWNNGYGDSYEIGVRSKEQPSQFKLIQPTNANERNIQMLCEMTKVLLDYGFTPTQLQEAFS